MKSCEEKIQPSTQITIWYTTERIDHCGLIWTNRLTEYRRLNGQKEQKEKVFD